LIELANPSPQKLTVYNDDNKASQNKTQTVRMLENMIQKVDFLNEELKGKRSPKYLKKKD